MEYKKKHTILFLSISLPLSWVIAIIKQSSEMLLLIYTMKVKNIEMYQTHSSIRPFLGVWEKNMYYFVSVNITPSLLNNLHHQTIIWVVTFEIVCTDESKEKWNVSNTFKYQTFSWSMRKKRTILFLSISLPLSWIIAIIKQSSETLLLR